MRDMNDIIAERRGQMTWDELMQRYARVCKERDELHRTVDQLVKRLNDETEKLEKLKMETKHA